MPVMDADGRVTGKNTSRLDKSVETLRKKRADSLIKELTLRFKDTYTPILDATNMVGRNAYLLLSESYKGDDDNPYAIKSVSCIFAEDSAAITNFFVLNPLTGECDHSEESKRVIIEKVNVEKNDIAPCLSLATLYQHYLDKLPSKE